MACSIAMVFVVYLQPLQRGVGGNDDVVVF